MKASPNWKQDQPLSGVSIILANYVPGKFAEYQDTAKTLKALKTRQHVAFLHRREDFKRWLKNVTTPRDARHLPPDHAALLRRQGPSPPGGARQATVVNRPFIDPKKDVPKS